MFYKIMNNDIVVDLLQEIRYIRYLPKSKRWVNTDAISANAIMALDGETIYRLVGRNLVYEKELVPVTVVPISAEEFEALSAQLSIHQKENNELRKEIDNLKSQLEDQKFLLQQILSKLS